ncbi:MAG: hypothetical protein KGQ50_01520 [Bacteroidetes bacterium]|nr:hypothetical protein [Bacteroidota bacterium]
MIMKWIATLLFIFIYACGYSQKLIVSDEIPLRSEVKYDILGEIKGNALMMSTVGLKYEVMGFDEQMRNSWTKELNFEKKQISILGYNVRENDFTLIYQVRQQGDTYIRACKYDPSANLKDSSTILNMGFVVFFPEYEMVISEDKSKILFYAIDNGNELHAFVIDNQSMELLWEKRINIDNYSNFENPISVSIDNDGNMYSFVQESVYKQRREEGHFRLIIYGKGQAGPRISVIHLGEKIVYDARFIFDNLNKKLIASGFYYNRNPEKAEGFFLVKLSPEGMLEIAKLQPFNDRFVSDLEGKDARNNRGIMNISISDLLLRKDGGLLIVGEESQDMERRISNMNRMMYDNFSRSIIDYYYNDIFIIALNPTGEFHWQSVLYKKQYSQDDMGAFSSFFIFRTPEKLHLLFNDEIKYENTVSEYLLRGDGKSERKSILSTENQKIRLRFKDALQVNANRIIIPSERRGRLRLARLEF